MLPIIINRNVLSPKVLTGDKQETAINIGYSSQLLTDEQHEPFIVDGETFDVSGKLHQVRRIFWNVEKSIVL